MRLAALFLLAAMACHPPPTMATSLPPDASDASAYGPASPECLAACAQLAGAGCSEGRAPNCATRLDVVSSGRLVRLATGEALSCPLLSRYVHTYADAITAGVGCTP